MSSSRSTDALTHGRLGGLPNAVLVDHALGPRLAAEAKNLDSQIRTDLAHAVMLERQRILSPEQAKQIIGPLLEVRELGIEGFPLDPNYGSLLLQIERLIASRSGPDVAGRLHTGRSRNDLSAAVDRLVMRDLLLQVAAALLSLQERILRLAARHVHTVMPGYTHLQHAQPTTYGHYLLRHYYALERDQQRLEAAFERTNRSALGGAAMVGTTWRLDRDLVADLLGHEGLVEHATDSGIFSRDYPAENAAVLSILISNVGRLAGDFYVWSSWEFGMVELSDDMAGTSSMMPQKKNPQAIERIRALSGSAIGWLPMVLGALRSATSSDLDLLFVPDPTGDMARTTFSALALMDVTLAGLTVRVSVMEERAVVNWSTASNLADELVRHTGLSFRAAHQIVGRLVRNAVSAGIKPGDVTTVMLDNAANSVGFEALALPAEALRRALDPRAFLDALVTTGSARPDEVRAMVRSGRLDQRRHVRWAKAKARRIDRAGGRLEAAVERIMGRSG